MIRIRSHPPARSSATRHLRRLLCGGFLCGSALAALAGQGIAPGERQALLDLYARTGGEQWTVSTGWGGPVGSECQWYGVRCDDARQHVIGLHLPNNQLRGALPRLGGLPHLQTLTVSLNHLRGTLPLLAELPALRELKVNNNALVGPLPELRRLTQLERVVLANNRFDGYLPPLAGLTQLREFDASNNQLSGLVPRLRGLERLRRFDVSFNRLQGVHEALPALADVEGNPMTHVPDRVRL